MQGTPLLFQPSALFSACFSSLIIPSVSVKNPWKLCARTSLHPYLSGIKPMQRHTSLMCDSLQLLHDSGSVSFEYGRANAAALSLRPRPQEAAVGSTSRLAGGCQIQVKFSISDAFAIKGARGVSESPGNPSLYGLEEASSIVESDSLSSGRRWCMSGDERKVLNLVLNPVGSNKQFSSCGQYEENATSPANTSLLPPASSVSCKPPTVVGPGWRIMRDLAITMKFKEQLAVYLFYISIRPSPSLLLPHRSY
ncbi:uncharacterized protein EV420DRAFT_1480999 [Desarmillaria tabescens]|uniref:Uncharacterized protein n=1 Tax=Armillaria tabescens TaxID=1929756 RepID=A0AA39N4G9_ARMTA|nr:uncharacterized protein EV420DRAFT_1480999 [Desarmillaria tabescens]KAK0457128.1 hypothetical protein EV420DRAFT_1480999 [Desarmillaria tabescens]